MKSNKIDDSAREFWRQVAADKMKIGDDYILLCSKTIKGNILLARLDGQRVIDQKSYPCPTQLDRKKLEIAVALYVKEHDANPYW